MLPFEYVDLHWDETPEDTLKPLTGPDKAKYKTAWELDLFPRIRHPEHYEMIYKNVCKPSDDRRVLGEPNDGSDPDDYGFGGVQSSSQVERPVLAGADLHQIVANIDAAKKALQGGVVKIGKYLPPINERDYDPNAAQDAAKAAAHDDATQAEFIELYRTFRASNTAARTATENFFGSESRGPRLDSGAPGPKPGRGSRSGSGSGNGNGNGPGKRSRAKPFRGEDLAAMDDGEENSEYLKPKRKRSGFHADPEFGFVKNAKVEDAIDMTSSRSKSSSGGAALSPIDPAELDDETAEEDARARRKPKRKRSGFREDPEFGFVKNAKVEDAIDMTSSRSKSSSSGGGKKGTTKRTKK